MDYTVVDMSTWPRREHFEHYMSAVPCTYSMTTKLDISNLRRRQMKLYPTMLYLLTRTVNAHEPFRMALREGELVLYSSMEPCYTVFHPETETFSNIWTEFTDDYGEFLRRYNADLERYGSCTAFMAKPGVPENSFTVSMIPWAGFDGFNLNTDDFKYLIPIFTLGRYSEESGRCLLPIAVQVHHAVCDGYHICAFINDLQEQIRSL